MYRDGRVGLDSPAPRRPDKPATPAGTVTSGEPQS